MAGSLAAAVVGFRVIFSLRLPVNFKFTKRSLNLNFQVVVLVSNTGIDTVRTKNTPSPIVIMYVPMCGMCCHSSSKLCPSRSHSLRLFCTARGSVITGREWARRWLKHLAG